MSTPAVSTPDYQSDRSAAPIPWEPADASHWGLQQLSDRIQRDARRYARFLEEDLYE